MITSKINPPGCASQQSLSNRLSSKATRRAARPTTKCAALLVTLLCAVGSANMIAPASGAWAAGHRAANPRAGSVEPPALRAVSAAPLHKASVGVPTDRVYNVTQDTSWPDIQPAIDAANPGDVITAAAGLYTGPLNVISIPLGKQPLTLTGAGAGSTIISGTNASGVNGVTLDDGTSGITITQLTLRNFDNGIYGPDSGGSLSHILLEDIEVISNNLRGIFSQAFSTSHITFRRVDFSFNGNRGIWLINGTHNNITVTESLFRSNILTGIDLSDGSASGVTIVSNTVTNQGDNGIGLLGLTSGAGPNLVAGNVLTDNGRLGIEIKVPNGTGLETGDGSIVVRNNQVTLTATPADKRDLAGIAVVRRARQAVNGNADVPTGVIIRNNTVSGYNQTNTPDSHEGFGIVVEGTNIRVVSNTLNNNEIGLQVQETISGTRGYIAPGFGDNATGSAASPATNDAYFDRGNAIDTCAVVTGNTLSGNGTDFLAVGPVGTPTVTNTNTTEVFCSIQAAIDDADTLNGHTLRAGPATYTETVLVNKALTLLGANAGISPITGTRGAESIVIPDTNSPLTATLFAVISSNVTIDGFLIDGDNAALSGGTLIGGVDVNAARGIANNEAVDLPGSGSCPGWGTLQNLTAQNNIVRNLQRYGVALCSGTFTVMNGNQISTNAFSNLLGIDTNNNDSRTAVILEGNAFAAISHNQIVGVRRGVRTTNLVGPGSPALIDGNVITAEVGGIMVNNHYGSSQVFTISNNTITAITPNTGIGIRLWSLQTDTSARVINNTVTGMDSGITLWNLPTTNPVVIDGGVLRNNNRGILVYNVENFGGPAPAGFTSGLAQNVLITGSNQAGIYLRNQVFGTNAVSLTALGNTLVGNANGIIVESNANGQPATLNADNNLLSSNTNAGVVVSDTGIINAALSGAPGQQNTFVNNGPSGSANITVTAPFGAPAVNAFWNDWNSLNLSQIENTIYHQADSSALKQVDYFTLTVGVAPLIAAANGIDPITYTASITGFYGNLAGAVISLTSTGAPNVIIPASITTDAAGQATLALTSTVAGTEILTTSLNGITTTHLITFTAVPQVVARKSSNPVSNTIVGPAQPVEYVVTVTPTVSVLNLTITDSVPANANYVAGSASASPGATISGPSPFIVTVPVATAGQPITFTFAVTAQSTLNASLTFTNSARVSSTSTPLSATNVITHFTGRVTRLRDAAWFTGYQAAINNVNTVGGDTLLGLAGNYTESLSLTKGVSLTGVSSDTVIVRPSANRVLNVSGAVISNGVVISGMTFTGGSLPIFTGDGAGIRVQNNAQLIINNVQVINNTAPLASGGGIYAEGSTVLTITNSAILSNTAGGNGGGINAQGQLVVLNSNFANNRATGGTSSGGAIRADGLLAIAGSSFSNNQTPSGILNTGGAVSINAIATIVDSAFISNTASGGGGVSVIGGSATALTNTNFISNTGNSGGAIYVQGNGNLQIAGGTFSQNTASNGGAIARSISGNRAITILGTQFYTNVASGSSGSDGGSAVYAAASGNLTVQDSRFEGNRAPSSQGAIRFSSNGNTLVITRSIFLNNTASGAGAVRVDGGSTGLIVNSIFGRNSASAAPAAIEANGASLTILHTTIASPTLSSLSAILINNGVNVNVTNTLVLSHSTALLMLGTGTVREDYNFFKTAAPTIGPVTSGGHSLSSGNADLVDVAADDYHLVNGNLAVDAGINLNINTDYDGAARPQGLGVDIGALESPFSAAVDLTLSKRATPGTGLPGQTVVFTLSAANTNSAYVANGVVITDDLPAGILAPSITSSGALITQTSGAPNLAWSVEPLLPGQTVLITITGVITPDAVSGTGFTNTAGITSTTVDSDTTNNTASATVQVGDLPAISKAADAPSGVDVPPNAPLIYTIVVTAQSDLSNLIITDSLPTGVGYVSANGSLGSVSYAAPQVQLSVPFVPANTVITLTINTTAPVTGSLTFTNTAWVSSTNLLASQDSNAVSHTVAVPTAQFSSATASAGEGSGNATLQVTLSHPSAFLVTVNYATSDGTALAPSDYAAASGNLVFAAGSTVATTMVQVNEDGTDESDETFKVTLGGATGATLGTPVSVTVTITDNDATPTPQFTSAAYTVTEGTGNAILTVTLSTPSVLSIYVTYHTSDGTAVAVTPAGGDYVSETDVITFAPGATTAAILVAVSDDAVYENNELFNVVLDSAINANLGAPITAAVTIVDNETVPVVQFNPPNTIADEGSSAQLTATLSGPSALTVTVKFATSDQTALAGSDYGARSGVITFAPGALLAAVAVPISADLVDESPETLSVTLSDPSGATLGTPSSAAILIVDKNGTPTVQFERSSTLVSEDAATVALTLTLSNPSANFITVTYTTQDETAMAPADYTASSGTVTFAPGATTASLVVPVKGDEVDESDETFAVRLTSPTNAAVGTPNAATVIIEDKDGRPTASFGNAAYSASEGARMAVITVSLSNPSTSSVSVSFKTMNGTAIAGNDYMTATGTITFAPGITAATFVVTLNEDAVDEADEVIQLELTRFVNADAGTQKTAVLTVIDNDGTPSVRWSAPASTVLEGAGSVTLLLELSNPSARPVTVTYSTGNGSAIAGGDYVSASNQVVFAPGAITASIRVSITNDNVNEASESFSVKLGSDPSNAELGTPNDVVVTIADDDGMLTAQFTQPGFTVDEKVGIVVLTVTLSRPSDRPVVLSYSTADETAVNGQDYIAISGTLSFAPGVITTTLELPILDDAIYESNETLRVTLTEAAGSSQPATPSVITTAQVTILDNEPLPPTIRPRAYLPTIMAARLLPPTD